MLVLRGKKKADGVGLFCVALRSFYHVSVADKSKEI